MKEHTSQHIENEASYQKTLSILNQQIRLSKVLCMLMNMLESYRQSRKMGWSRPWNKYGLTTFQSFKLDPLQDKRLSEQALACLNATQGAPKEALDFTHHLLTTEKRLMGFLFFSEYIEDGQQYEKATLSFGQKVKNSARFRDRFDIVFDAPVIQGEVQALARIRLYIDPYRQEQKEPLSSISLHDHEILQPYKALFEHLCHLS